MKTMILFARFSLLNIETILSGMPNTESRKVSRTNGRIMGTPFSPVVVKRRNSGTTIIMARAIKDEMWVNIFRLFLFN